METRSTLLFHFLPQLLSYRRNKRDFIEFTSASSSLFYSPPTRLTAEKDFKILTSLSLSDLRAVRWVLGEVRRLEKERSRWKGISISGPARFLLPNMRRNIGIMRKFGQKSRLAMDIVFIYRIVYPDKKGGETKFLSIKFSFRFFRDIGQ